jgi:DNA-binding transcriptional ArsR family regulator
MEERMEERALELKAEILKALAQPTRLRILEFLRDGEKRICEIVPAFARDAESASQTVRLPVSVSFSLTAASLALALVAGGLASWLMARRTAGMKPAEILRKM